MTLKEYLEIHRYLESYVDCIGAYYKTTDLSYFTVFSKKGKISWDACNYITRIVLKLRGDKGYRGKIKIKYKKQNNIYLLCLALTFNHSESIILEHNITDIQVPAQEVFSARYLKSVFKDIL